VAEERAQSGFRRRRREALPAQLGGGEAAGEEADGGGFDIAFAAGDLAGEADRLRYVRKDAVNVRTERPSAPFMTFGNRPFGERGPYFRGSRSTALSTFKA
jgi:hypothetical protein